MKTAKQLKDERGEKLDALNAITTLANTESRELKPEEATQFDTLEAEIRELNASVIRAETAERLAAEAATRSTAPLGRETNEDKRQKDIAQFSIRQAILDKIDGNAPTGIQREMQDEAQKEARQNNVTINGIGIPRIVMESRSIQRRDNSVTMPTQPEDGAAVVQTDKRVSMMDMLRNQLVTEQLGATVFTDLVGNTEFVRMTTRPAATWKAEVAELDKSNVKFGTPASLAPKRVGTYTVESLQFLRQTTPEVDAKIKREITYSIAEAIDVAAIQGTGTSNQPLGILNDTDITSWIAAATNGVALTRAQILAIETALAEQNVRSTNLKWLMNARTAAKLMNTAVDAGSGLFVMQNRAELMGYPVVLTNFLTNAAKGTATSVSKVIFGDFSNLYIGLWGGIDLTVDPYTLISAGQIRIVAQAFADVAVFDPAAFTGIKDAVNA